MKSYPRAIHIHPRLAAICLRAHRDDLILCCGCLRRSARRGVLCRSCAIHFLCGGWKALPYGPTGEPNAR